MPRIITQGSAPEVLAQVQQMARADRRRGTATAGASRCAERREQILAQARAVRADRRARRQAARVAKMPAAQDDWFAGYPAAPAAEAASARRATGDGGWFAGYPADRERIQS